MRRTVRDGFEYSTAVMTGGGGSHRVFAHPDVAELVNLQDIERGQAKRYQVRQVVGLVRRHDLTLKEEG
ncbi:MAG: hypothetical protein LC808_21495 [Actinobacteria bacterium]|nr:hypothetical protein [Actinomycetota bacterium]